MDAIADWVWFVGGGGVAIIALALLYWSLLHDRSRGRRRCPKCWYDMSGSPPPGLTCSECGFTAKREKKLLKTRRHWRRAMVASLPLLLGVAMLMTPHVMRSGWTTYVPTAVLVWLAPMLEDHPTSALAEELTGRVERFELRPWHWRTLMRQVEKRDDLVWPVDLDMPKRWLRNMKFSVEVVPSASRPFWLGAATPVVDFEAVETFGLRVTSRSMQNWWEVLFEGELTEEREQAIRRHAQLAAQMRFRGASVYLIKDKGFTAEASDDGTYDVVFRISLFSGTGQFWTRWPGAIEPDQLLWSGEVRRPIRIVGSINDVMTQVSDPAIAPILMGRMEVVPVGDQMRVYRMGRTGTGSLAIGGTAELYRDGSLYGAAQIWVDGSGHVHVVGGGFGSSVPFLSNEKWVRDSKWTLRFRSGAEAIYDVGATHYWEGEFEVELAPHARWHHWLYPVVESNDGDAQ